MGDLPVGRSDMPITDDAVNFKVGVIPKAEAIIAVYTSAELNRPTKDVERIASMYANATLVITAWKEDKLVGVARSVTDFCYCCYLSDLAVRKEFQHQGIGRKLIALTKSEVGEETTLLLLSAPGALEYYPKIGFETVRNGFVINRKR